jgi:hypothetical protein
MPPIEWISTREAATLLEMSTGGVLSAAKRGRIAARKEGDGGRAPYLLDRASVVAYRSQQRERDDERARGSTVAAKHVVRAVDVDETEMPENNAPPASTRKVSRARNEDAMLRRRLLLLTQCGLEGVFEPDEALTKIRTLLSGES